MILPHLLAQETYRNYWHSRQGFKILDNGANEGVTVSTADLLTLGRSVNANEIVVPDVLMDYEATISRVRHFFADKRTHDWDNGFMGVLQGEDKKQLLKCLSNYIQLKRVTSIAIPRLICGYMGKDARLEMAEAIREFTDMPIHCLGASADLSEPRRLYSQGIVRGLDTSLPYVLAKAGIDMRFDSDYASRGDHIKFFLDELSSFDIELCEQNEVMFLLSSVGPNYSA